MPRPQGQMGSGGARLCSAVSSAGPSSPIEHAQRHEKSAPSAAAIVPRLSSAHFHAFADSLGDCRAVAADLVGLLNGSHPRSTRQPSAPAPRRRYTKTFGPGDLVVVECGCDSDYRDNRIVDRVLRAGTQLFGIPSAGGHVYGTL